MAGALNVSNKNQNVWPRRLLIAGGVLGAILLVSALAFKIFQPIQVLPRIRLSPGFSFTDQHGTRLTNEDLRGKIVLYTFAYSGCPPDVCAVQNQVFKGVQQRLGQIDTGGVPVELITISVDAQHETPATLTTYASQVGADAQNWRFVYSSDPKLLKTIIGSGFEVYYEPQDDGTIRLDPVFILVDGWGIIRGEYRYATLSPDVERIVRHLSVLGDEVKNANGPEKLAYEAAHLFLCYSP
jgi:protein SCO1/2